MLGEGVREVEAVGERVPRALPVELPPLPALSLGCGEGVGKGEGVI